MVTESDVRLFDIVTQAVQNYALIADLDNQLEAYDQSNDHNYASLFYFEWCKRKVPGRVPRPFNPGTVWMMTSAIIINSDKWVEYLPKTKVSQCEEEWGLSDVELSYPIYPDLSIQALVNKMRNALSHSKVEVTIGRIDIPWLTLLKETFFIFSNGGGFELKISIYDLSRFISRVYEEISPVMKEFMKTYEKNIGE